MNPLRKNTYICQYKNHSVIFSGIENFHRRVKNSQIDANDIYVVFTAFYVGANEKGMFTNWFRNILSTETSFILVLNSQEEEANVKKRFGKEILERNILVLNVGEFVAYYLMDKNSFHIQDCKKEYTSVLNGKKVGYKKRHLGDRVTHKILISSTPHKEVGDIPCLFKNDKFLSSDELNDILNKCSVGMMLSRREGQPRAIREYFLCGLPVVSLEADGGRMSYLNKGNAVIVKFKDPDNIKCNVKLAVDFLNENLHHYDPWRIRSNHIANMRFALDSILKNVAFVLNSTHGHDLTHEELLNLIDPSQFETIEDLKNTAPLPLNFEGVYTYIDTEENNLSDKIH
tara:strand:- start:2174 stop:3202 length:1029 start_codon:yes stop_codon:yes gene_type:complete